MFIAMNMAWPGSVTGDATQKASDKTSKAVCALTAIALAQ